MKVRSGSLLSASLGDEVVILDRRSDLYLALNGSAAALWPLLERGCQPAELQDALVAEFDIDPAQAERDVDSFLAALRDLQLIDDDA